MVSRIILILILVIASQAGVEACGDKYTLTGSNCALPLTPGQEGHLVVYRGSTEGESMLNSKLVEVLRRAGHDISVVDDMSELSKLLAEDVDLVLAYQEDAETLAPMVADSVANPMVLPLMFEATQFEIAKVQKEFPHVINAPVTASRLSETINKALASR